MRTRKPTHTVLAQVVLLVVLAAAGARYLERFEVYGRPNELKRSKAAYLWASRFELVNWNEWGPTVLARAANEDKPLFVDVGTFWSGEAALVGKTCFSEPEIAQYMNDNFVCAKVDAAQRPDLALALRWQAYAVAGIEDIPLYLVCTPEGEAFAATGPLPPDGNPSLLSFLRDAKELWQLNRDEVRRIVSAEAATLEKMRALSEQRPAVPSKDMVVAVRDALMRRFDPVYGGFFRAGQEGKRLEGTALAFLLQRAEHGDREAERLARTALERFAESALHDPLYGGFHLRSYDRRFQLLDFSKATESTAQMLFLYVRAGALLDDPSSIAIARKTALFLQAKLWDRVEAHFFTGLAGFANPEEPGRYYVWSVKELEEVLTPRELRAIRLRYGIEGKSRLDWDPSLFPLRPARSYAEVGVLLGASEKDARETVADALEKMADALARKTLEPPKDGTVYTDVNGMAAFAFAMAAEVLADWDYAQVARRTIDRIMALPRDRFGLLPHGPGMEGGLLADQVWPARAAIVLYRLTRDEAYLKFAKEQLALIEMHFEDRDGWWGLWARAEDKRRDRRVRQRLAAGQPVQQKVVQGGYIALKPCDDGDMPSPNAAAAMLAMELHETSGDKRYLDFARRTIYAFGGSIRGNENTRAGIAMAIDRYIRVQEGKAR